MHSRSQHMALRAAAGQISNRVNSTIASPYVPPSDRSQPVEGSAAEYDNTLPEIVTSSSSSTSSATLQALPTDPIPLRDVGAIQSRVVGVFDALQTSDQMTPAQLSLIKTVRETASDPEIMAKIVNNGSFQEFMMHVPSLLGERRPQIAGEGYLGTQTTVVIDDYDSENEFFGTARRSSFSSTSSTSSTSSIPSSSASEYNNYENYSSSSDEETNFIRRRSRRVLPNDADPNSIAQQRALHRLDELCHQISPDIAQSSSVKRPATPPSDFCETPEPDVSKPTMEGPGIPGVPKAVPETPPADAWTNPVYLFVVTACVIPITILAVTAAVYPSPKTWSLLRNGFKAVCNKILS